MSSNITTILFVLLLFTSLSHAKSDLELIGASCNEEGVLTIAVTNEYDTEILSKNISINISYEGMPLNSPIGNWSERKIPKDAVVTFRSINATLPYKGDYQLILDFKSPEKSVLAKSIIYDLEGCPGYRYDCSISNLSITSCILY